MSNLKNNLFIISIFLILAVSCQNRKNSKKVLNESKIINDTIFSKYLNEDRLISVYLPKGYLKSNVYPVVYAADGQIIVDSYKKMLDSLINNKTLSKFILIGVHSNERKISGKVFEYRNYEYVKGFSGSKDTTLAQLYVNHYKFFTQEVINYAEMNYGVSTDDKDRIFYGTSNGAGFGVSIGAENPNLFSNYICFSMAGGNYKNLNWDISNYPYYYLSYGSQEPAPFIKGAIEFEEFLTQNNYKHEQTVYEGGHNRKMWRKEFFNIIPKILKKTTVNKL